VEWYLKYLYSTNLTQQNTLTQVETCDDEEKTIVLERYYIDENGLKQGLFERFYKDGQVKEKCTYKNDQLITKSEILIQALILFFLKIIHSLT